jgi:hypothetical protein
MVMTIDVGEAHCAGLSGVKVYRVLPGVTVLMTAGLHMPVIPSMEIADRAGAILFWHNGPI